MMRQVMYLVCALVLMSIAASAAPNYYVDNNGYIHTPGIVGSGGKSDSISRYASLTAAISAIGSTKTSLVIDSTTKVTGNTTVPKNISLLITNAGLITKSSGTLNIVGPFISGPQQVFSGFGTTDITFSSGSAKEVSPEWFGTVGNGIADDSTAWQSAINAAGSTMIRPAQATFLINSPLRVTTTYANIDFNGSTLTTAQAIDMLYVKAISVSLSNGIFDGANVGLSGVVAQKASRGHFKKLTAQNFVEYGIKTYNKADGETLGNNDMLKIDQCVVTGCSTGIGGVEKEPDNNGIVYDGCISYLNTIGLWITGFQNRVVGGNYFSNTTGIRVGKTADTGGRALDNIIMYPWLEGNTSDVDLAFADRLTHFTQIVSKVTGSDAIAGYTSIHRRSETLLTVSNGNQGVTIDYDSLGGLIRSYATDSQLTILNNGNGGVQVGKTTSVVYNPPSLVSGQSVTNEVSVTNCVLGDYARASFTNDLNGVTLSAYVSSTDTITALFTNTTSTTVNLTQGYLNVVCIKE